MLPVRPRPCLPLLAGTVLIASGWAIPAMAQEDYRSIVTIMRACSQIADVPARVMCYDNNIRPSAAASGAATAAPAAAPMAPPPSAAPQAPPPSTFGSEMVASARQPEREAADDDIVALVAAIAEEAPGIYLLTLADGAQWRFVDSAPPAWSPPRPGAQIELERGSLGAVFLTYDGQRRLRVRRIR